MRTFPALELIWPSEPTDDERDIALAFVDDEGPLAVEALRHGVRLFFRSVERRDNASRTIEHALPSVARTHALVPDENWAERSQAAITPVTIGRLVVAPPWWAGKAIEPAVDAPDRHTAGPLVELIIQPSMGFGTGHHASTRLCLSLLQDHLKAGDTVLDVGTGSGLLAIAASRLGAGRVVAVDTDPDALENARENVALNQASGIDIALVDITATDEPVIESCSVALANLTGTLLGTIARTLIGVVIPAGVVIASGYQPHERDEVTRAFAEAGGELVDERFEQDWVGAAFRRTPSGA